MAYTDDAVLSKLSALNETHESIATTAQWIMFHRRHANQTVRLWLTKLKDLPSAKRLNMIYLANEVTQQSKARHKEDFLNAFAPFIADATSVAYKGASSDVQNKLRRVADVWRERSIFDKETLHALYEKLEEIDRSRPSSNVGGFGGASFGAAGPPVPPEFAPMVRFHQDIIRGASPMKTALATAHSEYEKLTEPMAPLPALPLQAARLNGLLKVLANAEGAVAESLNKRREMIRSLEHFLALHQAALKEEEEHLKDLSGRRTVIEKKKNEVEATIISSQVNNNQEQGGSGDRTSTEPERPQFEALTPPHHNDAEDFYQGSSSTQNGSHLDVQAVPVQQPTFPTSAPGIEMLSHLASQYHSVPVNVNGSHKKRKLAVDDFPDLGGDDGIDADVQEMLKKEQSA